MRKILCLSLVFLLLISCDNKTEFESYRAQLSTNNSSLENINKFKVELFKAAFEEQFLMKEISEQRHDQSVYAINYIDSLIFNFNLIGPKHDFNKIDSNYRKVLKDLINIPIEGFAGDFKEIIFSIDSGNITNYTSDIAYNKLLWIEYNLLDLIGMGGYIPFCGINEPIQIRGYSIKYSRGKTIVLITKNDHSPLISFNVTNILSPDEKKITNYEVKNDDGNIAVLINTAAKGKYKIEGYITCSDKRIKLPSEGRAECIFLIK